MVDAQIMGDAHDGSLQAIEPPSGRYEYTLATDDASLAALRNDWQRLYSNAARPRLSQCFEWAKCAWECFGRQRGAKLHCLVARSNGEAVLIWPLIIRREYYVWSIARQLGMTSDYSGPLVHHDFANSDLIADAWAHLSRSAPCDVIWLLRVREDSPMHKTPLAGVVVIPGEPAPYVSFDEFKSWDDFCHSLSKNLREQLFRKRRRLEEMGTLRFEVMSVDDDHDSLLAWLFTRKQEWLADTGKPSPEMHALEIRDFCRVIVKTRTMPGRVLLQVLWLDDRPIAAGLISVDEHFLEDRISAFDLEYGKYSPGMIFLLYRLEWAFRHGLPFDFRPGTESYKKSWANRTCETYRYEFFKTGWGRMHLLLYRRVRGGRIGQLIRKAGVARERMRQGRSA